MKTAEMKQILADKFKAENCYFTKGDIIIEKKQEVFIIYIKDYEHIQFIMHSYKPDEFGFIDNYTVHITNDDMHYNDESIIIESKEAFDYKSALLELGYYIATRF